MTEKAITLKRWSIFCNLYSGDTKNLSVDYLIDMSKNYLIDLKKCPSLKEEIEGYRHHKMPDFLDVEDYFVFQMIENIDNKYVSKDFINYFYNAFKENFNSFFKKEKNVNFFLNLLNGSRYINEDRNSKIEFFLTLVHNLLKEENGFFNENLKNKIFFSCWNFSHHNKKLSSFNTREIILEYFLTNTETKFSFIKEIKDWEILFNGTCSENVLKELLKFNNINWSIQDSKSEKFFTLSEKYNELFPQFKKEISDTANKSISNDIVNKKYNEFILSLFDTYDFEKTIKKGPSIGEIMDWSKYKTKSGFPLFLLSINKNNYLSNKVLNTNKGIKEMSFSFLDKLKQQNPTTPFLPSWLEYSIVSGVYLKRKEFIPIIQKELEEKIKEIKDKEVIFPYFSQLTLYIDNFDLIQEGLTNKLYKEITFLGKKTDIELFNGKSTSNNMSFDKLLKFFNDFNFCGSAVNKIVFGAPNFKSQIKLLELIFGKLILPNTLKEDMSTKERFKSLIELGEKAYLKEVKSVNDKSSYEDMSFGQKSFYNCLTADVEIIPEILAFTLLCKSNWGSCFDAKEKLFTYLSNVPIERFHNNSWKEYFEELKNHFGNNENYIPNKEKWINLFEEKIAFINIIEGKNSEKIKNPLRF